jgi:hypothetical protein
MRDRVRCLPTNCSSMKGFGFARSAGVDYKTGQGQKEAVRVQARGGNVDRSGDLDQFDYIERTVPRCWHERDICG